MKAVLEKHDNKLTLRDEETTLRVIEGSFIYKNQYCSHKVPYSFSNKPPSGESGRAGGFIFSGPFEWGVLERGAYVFFDKIIWLFSSSTK
jgi:hypothetical protein